MKFFQSVTSLEELKKLYRILSLELHPDRPTGNAKAFIQMKDEYDLVFKLLSRQKQNEHARNNTKASFTEGSEEYSTIIDALMKYHEIEIEVVGTWVYIRGNTFAIKSELKELGFKWAKAKKAWYWHPEGYVRRSKRTYSMDEIREMHGSQKVKEADKNKAPQLKGGR